MASDLITSWQIDGETMQTVTNFIFLGSKITADGDCSHKIKRCLLLGRKAMTNLDSIWKSKRHYFANKGPSSQNYGFSSSHVWMRKLDHKERWVPKNWCKEIETVNSKGNQCWMFIGRTDAEAPILWSHDAKSWLIEKDLNVGKDWRQVEKGMTEDEMVRWHHQLDGHEFEQAPGVGGG